MSATLSGFIDEVVELMRNTVGLHATGALGHAKRQPFAPVYASYGSAYLEPGQVYAYTHQVRVGLLGPVQDMDRANRVLLPKLEEVAEALWAKMLSGSDPFDNCEHFTGIDYAYGVIDWGNEELFGFLFTIDGVVLRRP